MEDKHPQPLVAVVCVQLCTCAVVRVCVYPLDCLSLGGGRGGRWQIVTYIHFVYFFFPPSTSNLIRTE